MQTSNRLKAIRTGRGISAADLARAARISRQTIYAMEAGSYIPNTATALELARALDVTVEEIFQLKAESPAPPESLAAEILADRSGVFAGQPVQVCRVGERTFAVPLTPEPVRLPSADGVCLGARTRGRVPIHAFSDLSGQEKRVLIAGCDPGISILGEELDRVVHAGTILASCSSRLALEWLKAGKVHVAGTHLRDARTNEYNVPAIRRLFPRGGYHIVTFAIWEEGMVTARNNPKGIRGVADLARKDVVLMNRESGSGSRDLLERELAKAGITANLVHGFGTAASGHLPAGFAVSAGDADCCIATRSAAMAFGLHFIPLSVERYDLVALDASAGLPSVRALFDVLNHLGLRQRLQMLAGYDTSQTGNRIA